MSSTTFNQLANKAVVRGDEQACRRMAEIALIQMGAMCPECGGRNTDSGRTDVACYDCHEQYDIASYVETLTTKL